MTAFYEIHLNEILKQTLCSHLKQYAKNKNCNQSQKSGAGGARKILEIIALF